MSEEELAAHRKWHAERPVGSAAKRADVKRFRDDAKAARALFAKPAPNAAYRDPEYMALCERIAELRAALSALHASQEAASDSNPSIPTEGVFG